MNRDFFTGNRHKLADALSSGIIVLSAYAALQRSNDSAHSFTQESNFWYLCGIEEPGWRLVIDGLRHHSWLIAPNVSEVHKTFDGSLEHAEAKRISGVDEVLSADDLPDLLRRLAGVHRLVYTVGQAPYSDHYNFELNPAIERNRQMLVRQFAQVQDCRKELSVLRALKQPEEITAITKAVAISVAAFKHIQQNMRTYRSEFQIEADFAREVRYAGASGCAYDSIVAAGKHACTLHYAKNDAKLANKQLVLMDMGAEYSGYAADITRTYAKGEPTKRQRQVHGAVEVAHHKIVSLIEPMLAVEEYQRSVDMIMKEALASIDLASDEDGMRRYFPHAISHGLGIDVHDSLGAPKYFQENMVLTVEPGIYISEEGIGVRIEDDIHVTKTGRKNLSAALSTGL